MQWLEEWVKDSKQLYAHIQEEKEAELLEKHLQRSLKYFHFIVREKQLGHVIDNFRTEFGAREYFNILMENVIYFHDVGKINRNFQIKKMNNKLLGGECLDYTDHSLLSALLYLEEYYPKGREWGIKGEEIGLFSLILLLNAYVIARHHTGLCDLEEFEESLIKLLGHIEEDPLMIKVLKKPLVLKEESIERISHLARRYRRERYKEWETSLPYIYSRLIYSLLVACDFYATSEYINGEIVNNLGCINNAVDWRNIYKKTNLYKCIEVYKDKRVNIADITEINMLRSHIFWEATETLKCYKQENIFYLEAPTGSGKTNTSIELVLALLNEVPQLNKVFYVFPFNTLGEQTYETLTNLFKNNKDFQSAMTLINSVTPIKEKIKAKQGKKVLQDTLDYESMLLDFQFLHNPFIITSHVKLFNLLFEPERAQVGGMYQLANSVIVLDEIQSYKNTLWTEIIGFLSMYAKLLNCKVIIMSATLPQLSKLLDDKEVIRLLPHCKNYFQHPLFKERVQLDFSFLEEQVSLEQLVEKVVEVARIEGKILIEFIKKQSAMMFYHLLKEKQEKGEVDLPIRLLTGDDNKWERRQCIKEAKEGESLILVTTQLIEAGVDIDMDIGFKNISLLDAEEQFLGRINRSCLRQGKAYFFYLDEAATIYRNDYRKQKRFTLQEKENQRLLIEKDFTSYYNNILKEVKTHTQKNNSHNLQSLWQEQLLRIKPFMIAQHMRLIDEDYYPITIFLGRTIHVPIDGDIVELEGYRIWEEYKALLQTREMSYAEKRVKLSQIQELVAGFTWKVKGCDVGYTERIGDIYYIEEGEKYFTNGKFDREKLSSSSFEMI